MELWNKIYAKFGDQVEGGSIIRAEKMILNLLDVLAPRSLLEIGTFNGLSAMLWSQKAESVVTVDINWKEIRKKVWDYMDCSEKITQYVATSNEDKKEFIATQNYDLAFVDGLHTAEGVEFDYHTVKHCKCVIFHDYKPEGGDFTECTNQRFQGIVDFVDSVSPDVYLFGSKWSYFALWLAEDSPIRETKNFKELIAKSTKVVCGKTVLSL